MSPAINGAVRCECGEYAVDMVRTVDGLKGFCAEHLAKCQAKIFEDIVRDLAKDGAEFQGMCGLCHCFVQDMALETHTEWCLYRRAVEATR